MAALLLTAKPAAGQAHEAVSCCGNLVENLKAAENAGLLDEAQHWATLIIQHEEAANPNGPLRAMALEHLASLMQDKAHFDEAEHLYQESIQLWEIRPGGSSLGLADALNGLGSLYNALGELQKAETLCRRAVAIRLEILGRNNEDVAIAYSNLGVVLLRQQKFQQSAAVAQEALGLWNQLHSGQDRSAVDLNTLALVRLHEHNFAEAIAYDQAALQKCKDFPPPDRWSFISYLHTLAVIEWRAGERCESLAAFQKAYDLLRPANFPNALEQRNLLSNYAVVLRGAGQKKKARKMERQAEAESQKILRLNRLQQYSVDVNSLGLKSK